MTGQSPNHFDHSSTLSEGVTLGICALISEYRLRDSILSPAWNTSVHKDHGVFETCFTDIRETLFVNSCIFLLSSPSFNSPVRA